MSQIKPTGDHLNAGSNSTPQALGTAGAGTSVSYSRADHVHAMPSASDVGAVSTSQVIDLAHGGTGSTTATAALSALGGVPLTSLGQTVATLNGGRTLTTSQVAALTGDVISTAGNPATTVVKINGQAVAATPASNGQVLTWSSSANAYIPGSIPSGGSGGGGLVFFLNAGTAGLSPTTGLPAGTKELGRTAEVAQTTVTSATLSQSSYDLVFGAVSDPLDPDVTQWPAGLFDFNLWISSNANQANQTIIQLKVYKYDGTNAPTLLTTSDDVSVYDPSVTAQYIVSVVLPQTTVNATDRLYIEIRAKATSNNRTVTLKFGDSTPSHLHSTLPSVGGSGLVRVLSGVFQNPAGPLYDSDVASDAAIAQSKISNLTNDLASKVATSQLGALNGVAQLDGSGTLRTSQIPALTTGQIAQITPSAIGAVPTTRTVSTSDGLTGGGALSGNLTLALTTTGVAAGLYGSSTKIPVLTLNDKGQVTAASEATAAGGGSGNGMQMATVRHTSNVAPQVAGTITGASWSTGSPTVTFTGQTGASLVPGMSFNASGISTAVIQSVGSGQITLTANATGTNNNQTVQVYNSTTTTMVTGASPAMDGKTIVTGDVILLTAQTASAQNGPWNVTNVSGSNISLSRPSWFTGTLSQPVLIGLQQGSAAAGFIYAVSSLAAVTGAISIGIDFLAIALVSQRTTNAVTGSNQFSGVQVFAANSATVAPFRFNGSGTGLNTTATAHTCEWDGYLLYLTNTDGVRTRNAAFVAAPAALTSAGVAGQIAYDASYFYICVTTNTWRRVALSTF